MNLHRMELVLKVAEFRSFTKAAEALKIPQPSLSQSILSLERELGTQLFNRTSNPISLTRAGKIYASKAKVIFDAINDLKNDISEISGVKNDKIRIGFSQNGYNLLPSLLPMFCKKFKDSDLQITQFSSALSIREMLLQGDLDVGMLILPIDMSGLDGVKILTQKTYVALSSTHQLSLEFKNESVPKIDISRLKEERFILPNQSLRSAEQIDAFFAAAGFAPKVLCRTETFDIANAIVASGAGACFSIPQMIKEDKASRIKLFDVGARELDNTLIIAYKKGKRLNHLAQAFIKTARKISNEI